MRPVANSTTLGTPMPTARASGVRTASTAATSWSSSSSDKDVSVGTTCGSPGSPSSISAAATFVPPTSTPMNCPFTGRTLPRRLGAGVALARVELAVGRGQQLLGVRPRGLGDAPGRGDLVREGVVADLARDPARDELGGVRARLGQQ